MKATTVTIATQAGVSPAVVSKVLHGGAPSVRVSAQTAERVRRIADELGYRPNAAARAMVSRRSRIIGALLVNTASSDPGTALYNPAIYELLIGANARAQEAGYVLSLVNVAEVGSPEAAQSRAFREHVLDGVLAVGRLPYTTEEQVRGLSSHVVWAEAETWRPSGCIRRDEEHAGALAARKLMEAGYRRLVWAGNVHDNPATVHFSGPERREGFCRAAASAGREVEHLVLTRDRPETFDYRAVAPFLTPDTGLGVYDAPLAHWLLRAAGSARRVPGVDFGLACCDDTQELRLSFADLSRVSFGRFELGYQAAEMLMRLIERPEEQQPSRKLRGEWIAGATIGVAPP